MESLFQSPGMPVDHLVLEFNSFSNNQFPTFLTDGQRDSGLFLCIYSSSGIIPGVSIVKDSLDHICP